VLDNFLAKFEAGIAPALQPDFAQVGTGGDSTAGLQAIVEAQSKQR
jgi:hypothetical protein